MRAKIALFFLLMGPPAGDAGTDEPGADDPPVYGNAVAAALTPHPGGLTADEVAEKAVESSPQVDLRRSELLATDASFESTVARFIPNLSLSATYSRLSPADINFGGGGAGVGALNEGPLSVDMNGLVVDSMGQPVIAAEFEPFEIPLNNYSLVARVSVPFSEIALRLLAAKRGAKADEGAAIHRREAEKVAVELEARLAYYDWLRAKAQVAVTRESVHRTRARLSDSEVRFEGGDITRVDVLRLDGLLATAEAAEAAAESFEEQARTNLALMMGEPAEAAATYTVGEDIMGPIPDLPKSQDRRALVSEAQRNRHEILALRDSAESMEQARRAARNGYYPRVDGFADFTYANPNQRFFPLTADWNASWTIGVGLTWDLSTILLSRSQTKQARANERIFKSNEAAMRRAVEMEVTAAYHERDRAKRELGLLQRSAKSARAAYDQAVAAYRGGEVTTTDVIEAEGERVSAALNEVNARIDLIAAQTKLERATGRMKPIDTREADEAGRPRRKLKE